MGTGTRRAIVICNSRYDDPALHALPGVVRDHANMTRVLSSPAAAFEVTALLDEGFLAARRAIAKVCRDAVPDDTVLFYYSGYSYCDRDGSLYLPVRDSSAELVSATAIDSEFVLGELRASASHRNVILVDGCHAGAFFEHNRGIPDGLFAITACGAGEYTVDTPDGGAFTCAVVEALERADTDRDADGLITIDDVHAYAKQKLAADGRAAVPQKWVWNVHEPIYLASAPRRVFLSYCRDDLALAGRIKDGLERRGFSIWFDREGIKQGNWKERVTSGLRDARALVVLMTPATAASDAVRKELDFATGAHVPVVPVTLGEMAASALPDWFLFDHGATHRIALDPAALEPALDAIERAIRAAAAPAAP